MTALTGQTIASSYEQVLHVDTDGGGNANNLLSILDGDNGTTFGLKIATNKVEVIPGSDDANAFEVSQADGTPVLTVNSSSPEVTVTALTVDDVAVDGKVITMTGSSSDTAVFTAGTNGTLSIVTTDAAAAAANIQITADGTVDIDSAGALTLDSGADIVLDAEGADIIFKDGGTSIGTFTNSSSDFVIASNVNDKDILIKGVDNSSAITAATFDMSDAGSLSLNSDLRLSNTKKVYFGADDDTYIYTSADDVLELIASTERRLVINSSGVGFGKVPSFKMAISFATGDIDIKDAGTALATEAGWIQVAIGGGSDSYIRTYSSI